MANPSFFLASKSLRRQMLLEQIGIRFEVIDIDLGGARFPGEDPASYVLRLALDKAQAGRAQIESGHCPPVLGTNMSVVVGDRILGKPNNRREATAMLRLLGGRKHWVLGGIALVDGHEWQALSVSEVNFRAVSAWEADAYWETDEPRNKAGGYALQGAGVPYSWRTCGAAIRM